MFRFSINFIISIITFIFFTSYADANDYNYKNIKLLFEENSNVYEVKYSNTGWSRTAKTIAYFETNKSNELISVFIGYHLPLVSNPRWTMDTMRSTILNSNKSPLSDKEAFNFTKNTPARHLFVGQIDIKKMQKNEMFNLNTLFSKAEKKYGIILPEKLLSSIHVTISTRGIHFISYLTNANLKSNIDDWIHLSLAREKNLSKNLKLETLETNYEIVEKEEYYFKKFKGNKVLIAKKNKEDINQQNVNDVVKKEEKQKEELIVQNKTKKEKIKIRGIEIEIPDKENLIYLKRSENQSYAIYKTKIYVEKTEDNQFKSAVLYMDANVTSHLSQHRVSFDEYYFRDDKALLNNKSKFNLYLEDEKGFGGVFVQEMDLKNFNRKNQKYEILKGMWNTLEKKHNIKLPSSVIRSDHLNFKGSRLTWISYIKNINHLPDNNDLTTDSSKFHPKRIHNYPNYKLYMDKWINLSLSRHIEFQKKLKIKDEQARNYENFDKNKKQDVYLSEFIKNDNLIANIETEQEIKKTDTDDSLLAKKKIEEEKKKKELLAQKEAEEEKKKKELLAQKKAEEQKKKNELLAQKEADIQTEKDTTPPTIITAENVIVKSSSYKIIGILEDAGSDNLYIDIDGMTVEAKNGKFVIERFSPIDEKVKLVAIDQWGNKSEPVFVNVKVNQEKIIKTEKLEKLDPTKVSVATNKNKVALIFGIEKYNQTPAASYANKDAQYFYEYAKKVFGIPEQNIELLVDEKASLIESLGRVNKWLPAKIQKNKTDLIIFFAGHGLASPDGKDLYLLSQDSDPDLLSRTALSRSELFEAILKYDPKSVTMFFDTCFSGISRDEKTLLASARPVRVVADETEESRPKNFTIFSASQLDQISYGLKDSQNGIFCYFLMKGLEGNADINKDNKITNGELLSYMDDKISIQASSLGREQNPSLTGDPNRVLVSFN